MTQSWPTFDEAHNWAEEEEAFEKVMDLSLIHISFQDVNEIWWLETIGGHHWMARRVPDDSYVVMPNQLGIDRCV